VCCADSGVVNDGVPPLPCVTDSTRRAREGVFPSRLGPTVPVAPAALSVWQLEQPALWKTLLPAVALPPLLAGAAPVVVAADVDWATNAATSSICCAESCLSNAGMAPLPCATRSSTSAADGFF